MVLAAPGFFQGLETSAANLLGQFFLSESNDEGSGRFFGLNPWTAILTMAVLGVGVPAAFAYISVIILTLLNYNLIVTRAKKRRKRSETDLEDNEIFNWLPIVELLQEKGDNYFDQHKKTDCSLQNLCKTLSVILRGETYTPSEENFVLFAKQNNRPFPEELKNLQAPNEAKISYYFLVPENNYKSEKKMQQGQL